MPQLELNDLSARYGDVAVLDRISFTVEKGEIISLIGPSGSGKSTLLRVLVGLLPPAGGTVRLDGREVDYRDKVALREARARMAIVFQQFNLFQNMSVLANVTIAPVKVKGESREQAEAYATKLLERVGLGNKLDAYPDQLSGGQQQRVAIARALALKPEIVLLDEVTSALDPELVNEVLDVVRLLAADGMTVFFVSHEMAFVREVSSKVIFMAQGRVVESGSPAQIFDSPREARTQEFVSKILRH
ncbi:MAG: amino acid ABC transporter ATP-binding protein [Casimicrobiaceae bacterium]